MMISGTAGLSDPPVSGIAAANRPIRKTIDPIAQRSGYSLRSTITSSTARLIPAGMKSSSVAQPLHGAQSRIETPTASQM